MFIQVTGETKKLPGGSLQLEKPGLFHQYHLFGIGNVMIDQQ